MIRPRCNYDDDNTRNANSSLSLSRRRRRKERQNSPLSLSIDRDRTDEAARPRGRRARTAKPPPPTPPRAPPPRARARAARPKKSPLPTRGARRAPTCGNNRRTGQLRGRRAYFQKEGEFSLKETEGLDDSGFWCRNRARKASPMRRTARLRNACAETLDRRSSILRELALLSRSLKTYDGKRTTRRFLLNRVSVFGARSGFLSSTARRAYRRRRRAPRSGR